MHEVLVNRLGGLSLPRKSVVRLTDRPDMTLDAYRGRKTDHPDMTLDVYRGRKTTMQQQQPICFIISFIGYSRCNSPYTYKYGISKYRVHSIYSRDAVGLQPFFGIRRCYNRKTYSASVQTGSVIKIYVHTKCT